MIADLMRRTADRRKNSTLQRACALLLASLLTACHPSTATPPDGAATGISGMAQIDDARYLIVRDLKAFEPGARVGVLELNAGEAYTIVDVAIADWWHGEGLSSDLEAACAIPGSESDFLLLESGHWEGQYGRLFRIRLESVGEGYTAKVLGAYDIPEFDAKGPDDPGDEMEGLACAQRTDGRTLVILGERGGSSAYPSGLLRWFTIDPGSNVSEWTTAGRAGLEIDAPGEWHDAQTNRDVSALHLHSRGTLWAAAAEDLSDEGPFNSIVYAIGNVRPDEEPPIQLFAEFRVRGVLNGFKVEALASGTERIPNATLAVGTEDEAFGGTWRPLR